MMFSKRNKKEKKSSLDETCDPSEALHSLDMISEATRNLTETVASLSSAVSQGQTMHVQSQAQSVLFANMVQAQQDHVLTSQAAVLESTAKLLGVPQSSIVSHYEAPRKK